MSELERLDESLLWDDDETVEADTQAKLEGANPQGTSQHSVAKDSLTGEVATTDPLSDAGAGASTRSAYVVPEEAPVAGAAVVGSVNQCSKGKKKGRSRSTKLRILKYTTRANDFQVHDAIGPDGQCRMCDYVGPSLKDHCKQHLFRFFCICGSSFKTRPEVVSHIINGRRFDLEHEDLDYYYEASADKFVEMIETEPFLTVPEEFGSVLPIGRTTPLPRTAPANPPRFGGTNPDHLDRPASQAAITGAKAIKPTHSAAQTHPQQNTPLLVRDVRLTESEAEIKRSVAQIREERAERARHSQAKPPTPLKITVGGQERRVATSTKRPASPSATSHSTPATDSRHLASEITRLREERDHYRAQAELYCKKFKEAHAVLQKTQAQLQKMDDLYKYLATSQATINQYLGW